MLFLTRREGENIMIGDGIHIQVLSVSEDAGNVRIQIEAPDFVAVQCRDVDSEMTDRKPGPVITHKRRWRSLVTSV
ncbi:carbon storage regulator, partial [Pseudomonas avellanae]